MPLSSRAAVMVRPGEMEIREFPIPKLEEGAILLRVEMCGICGTDKHTWRGETKQYAGTAAESARRSRSSPATRSSARWWRSTTAPARGWITTASRCAPGDRLAMCPDVVCGTCYACRHTFAYPWCENLRGYGNAFTCAEPPHLMGGWAEYLYILPNAFVYHVPEALPTSVAVMVELMAVSYNLDKMKEFFTLSGEGFATGDTVVVQGAGPMGICHIIKARMMGAGDIIATDISDYRLAPGQGVRGGLYAEREPGPREQERIELVRVDHARPRRRPGGRVRGQAGGGGGGPGDAAQGGHLHRGGQLRGYGRRHAQPAPPPVRQERAPHRHDQPPLHRLYAEHEA